MVAVEDELEGEGGEKERAAPTDGVHAAAQQAEPKVSLFVHMKDGPALTDLCVQGLQDRDPEVGVLVSKVR